MTPRRIAVLLAIVAVVIASAWYSPDIARWIEGLTS